MGRDPIATDLRSTDRVTWEGSTQLAKCGSDVIAFEAARKVPSALLFLSLEEADGLGQRDAGGGRYKRLMDSIGEWHSLPSWH